MKCGGEEENNHVHKCPLCSTQRDDIHALKYHIRKEHNKNKRGNCLLMKSLIDTDWLIVRAPTSRYQLKTAQC